MGGLPGHDEHVASALYVACSLLGDLWEVAKCPWDYMEFDVSLSDTSLSENTHHYKQFKTQGVGGVAPELSSSKLHPYTYCTLHLLYFSHFLIIRHLYPSLCHVQMGRWV